MQLRVRLKQHTPIIHFQHDQEGAALRATELKPKLDARLRKKMGLGKDERLRYQINIRAAGRPDNPKDPPKPYFGNMGGNVKYKKTVYYRDDVELVFNTYFDGGLAEKIKEHLPGCIALENFGSCQSKGFGSFYISGKDTNAFDPIEKVLMNTDRPVYYFPFTGPPDAAFAHIDALYKAMKSGVNETRGDRKSNAYLKSLLWQYLNQGKSGNNLIIWEKRFMKTKLMNEKEKVDNPQYFRALLGVCDNFPFMRTKPQKPARMDEDYGDQGDFTLSNRIKFRVKNNRGIDRFKSPITFKPVNDRVYIILNPASYAPDEENAKIPGAVFRFNCQKIGGNLRVPDRGPDGQHFSLEKFMDFVKKHVNEKRFGRFDGDSAAKIKTIQIHKLEKGENHAT